MILETIFLIWFDLTSTWLTVQSIKSSDCTLKKIITVKKSISFANPNWPNSYKADTNCKWIFDCHKGCVCRLVCDPLGLPISNNCFTDKLIVSDVPKSKKKGRKTNGHVFCGDQIIDIISNGTKISLQLMANKRSKGGRFRCSVETETRLQSMFLRL